MNEWLLIISMIGRYDPALSMQKMPNEALCIEAGELAKSVWPKGQVLIAYKCMELKIKPRFK